MNESIQRILRWKERGWARRYCMKINWFFPKHTRPLLMQFPPRLSIKFDIKMDGPVCVWLLVSWYLFDRKKDWEEGIALLGFEQMFLCFPAGACGKVMGKVIMESMMCTWLQARNWWFFWKDSKRTGQRNIETGVCPLKDALWTGPLPSLLLIFTLASWWVCACWSLKAFSGPSPISSPQTVRQWGLNMRVTWSSMVLRPTPVDPKSHQIHRGYWANDSMAFPLKRLRMPRISRRPRSAPAVCRGLTWIFRFNQPLHTVGSTTGSLGHKWNVP